MDAEFYPSAEMQSVYSTDPVDGAENKGYNMGTVKLLFQVTILNTNNLLFQVLNSGSVMVLRYILIIYTIIIIMSCHQHGYPWPFLTTLLYRPLLLAGLQDYIPYCYVLTFDPAQKMLFQGDAPKGSDTFQWPVIERDRLGGLRLIIWDKVKVPQCQYRLMHLWTAWQLFPLDDD